ncbi:DUF6447 family protein [Methylomonas sp. LL1]|uniref:DUF6447 family protein n=1 Tax=Methylomonas sp. LL1 TaxID=2785785 RepID=UPI001E377371|nr:DUF6447 family protein [Methylomonas sp. LL1]
MTEEIPTVSTFTIEDKILSIDSLSDITKAQITNLQIVDAEIQRLQQQLGIAQVATSLSPPYKLKLPSSARMQVE